jgi:hypothetical protein
MHRLIAPPTRSTFGTSAWAVLLLACFQFQQMHAQVPSDGDASDLGQEDITVVGSYTPQLANAQVLPWQPSIPTADTSGIPALQYSIPLALPEVQWSAPPVRPVALGKPVLEPLPNLFAKFGFGTQFTPYAELGYASGRNADWSYGFNGLYTASNGQRENQLYALGEGQLFAKRYFGSSTLGLEGGLSSETVYRYGYPEEDTSFSRDEVRQRYLRSDAAIDFQPTVPKVEGLDYRIRAGMQSHADLEKDREFRPFLDSRWVYRIPDQPHRAALDLDYEQFRWSGPGARNRGVFRFRPSYTYQQREWSARAGFAMVLDTSRFRFLPDLRFEADLIRERLRFFVGWNSTVQSNSIRSLTEENPWLRDSVFLNNSRMEDRFFGFKGSASQRLSYRLRLSQKLVEDHRFFVNDSTDMRTFDVWYEDITLIALDAEAAFRIDERYRLSGAFSYRRFTDIGQLQQAWHEPSVSGHLRLRINPMEDLEVDVDVLGYGRTWGRLANGDATRLSGTADIGVAARYAYNRYFTIWAELNNMAGIKHQRYLNYPSYGFRAMAGLQFSF